MTKTYNMRSNKKKWIHWTTLIIYSIYLAHHFIANTLWPFSFFFVVVWVIVQYTEPQIKAPTVQFCFISVSSNRLEKDKHIWRFQSSGNKNTRAQQVFKKPSSSPLTWPMPLVFHLYESLQVFHYSRPLYVCVLSTFSPRKLLDCQLTRLPIFPLTKINI